MLAHGLNRPDPLSLLARSSLSARGMPRTLSFARRQAAVIETARSSSVQAGGRDTAWRLRAQVGSLATRPSQHCLVGPLRGPTRTAKQEIGWSLPRRVPSPRSGCVNYHWRFEPRSGCRDESATTRRASVSVANRKPISGAQRPQPATRHLVRQRLLRRLHTRENCSRISHLSDALSFVCVRAPGREPVVPVAWPAD